MDIPYWKNPLVYVPVTFQPERKSDNGNQE